MTHKLQKIKKECQDLTAGISKDLREAAKGLDQIERDQKEITSLINSRKRFYR